MQVLVCAVAVAALAGAVGCRSDVDAETLANSSDALVGVDQCLAGFAAPRGAERHASARMASDCSATVTVPRETWTPDQVLRIAVVVHVISDGDCVGGALTDDRIRDQLVVLNEDFRALPGTPGAPGFDSKIEFFLATEDPTGRATNGITRHCDARWYRDDGDYFGELAWDPSRYINIYTNTVRGGGGYVPFLPSDPDALAGQTADRVVVNWLAFGRGGPIPNRAQGRTATHEIGHYLGLLHTYGNDSSCGAAEPPGCYTTGDLVCDTLPTSGSHRGCPVGQIDCAGFSAPIANHMDLADDSCKTGFTREQVLRMRCTLATYRPRLAR